MSTGELQAPPAIGWAFIVPGLIGLAADCIDLNVQGAAFLSVCFIVIGLYFLGVFRRSFWIQDIDDDNPDALGTLDLAERDAWDRASHLFDQDDVDAPAAKASDVA